MNVKIGNTKIQVPFPELRFRQRNQNVFNEALSFLNDDVVDEDSEYNQLTAILVANRTSKWAPKTSQDLFKPSLKGMDFWKLKDMDKAVDRIATAKKRNEAIGLVTDFDVDGISSAVVMYLALTEYMDFDKSKIRIFVNNRNVFGYGFNELALDHVMESSGDDIPTLLITADQGSNDNETVELYKKRMSEIGYDYADVIVTDHHQINDGSHCDSAAAFINPQRPDDEFDDSTICGCVVALLLMSALREHLINKEMASSDTPRLTPLLTYASLATIADCVSLQSGYNRCIVRRGLSDINREVIPAWSVLKKKLNKPFDQVTAKDLGFTLGPAINADSRTGGDGSDAVNFLLAKNVDDASKYYEALRSRNNRRKEIDLSMQEAAIAEASKQYYNGRRGLVIYLPAGVHGIHGIVASRVKERFNCPTFIFSPKDVNEKDGPAKRITASGRSIDHIHLQSIVMNNVATHISLKGGGHGAAMGVNIAMKDFEEFQERFDACVKAAAEEKNLPDNYFEPHVLLDHIFQKDDLHWFDNDRILYHINRLEPYGQRFDEPVFGINAKVMSSRPFGKGVNENAHLNIDIRDTSGRSHSLVVFHYTREPWVRDLAIGQDYTFAVKLSYDNWKKRVGMQAVMAASGINAVTK
jgi:single-stranded-DNA-specific exonuclease